jgi:hypothetical protein
MICAQHEQTGEQRSGIYEIKDHTKTEVQQL